MNCQICEMKKSLTNDILFVGHNIIIKEKCPVCKRPLGFSVRHKGAWDQDDDMRITMAFHKYLGMEGSIDWASRCFDEGHIHCHFKEYI